MQLSLRNFLTDAISFAGYSFGTYEYRAAAISDLNDPIASQKGPMKGVHPFLLNRLPLCNGLFFTFFFFLS